MLGVEFADEAWERIESGDLTGFSIYGEAESVAIENAVSEMSVGDGRPSVAASNSGSTMTQTAKAADDVSASDIASFVAAHLDGASPEDVASVLDDFEYVGAVDKEKLATLVSICVDVPVEDVRDAMDSLADAGEEDEGDDEPDEEDGYREDGNSEEEMSEKEQTELTERVAQLEDALAEKDDDADEMTVEERIKDIQETVKSTDDRVEDVETRVAELEAEVYEKDDGDDATDVDADDGGDATAEKEADDADIDRTIKHETTEGVETDASGDPDEWTKDEISEVFQ
jgi:ElaB/YqjD/DUF883 family membrane-anchored ribosome-binding protein